MEYIAAAGTVLRGAASGLPVKALMFTLDIRPIKTRQSLLSWKTSSLGKMFYDLAQGRLQFVLFANKIDIAAQGFIGGGAVLRGFSVETAIPLGQVVDYGILREVLAEMKR